MAFFGLKIEKLAFHFVFMKGLKPNANFFYFYFGSQKFPKTTENIFHTYINFFFCLQKYKYL